MEAKPFRIVLGVAAAGAAVTAVVALAPGVRFAYRAEPLHVAIETAAALVALLATFLVFGRARRSRQLVDAALLLALALLALTNLLLATLPAVLNAAGGRVVTWAALYGHVAAAASLALAAFAPARRVRIGPWTAVAAACVLVALDALVVALVQHHLPQAVETTLTPERSIRPRLVGHPVALAVQLLIGSLYALATAGFARRGARRQDAFMSWLAVGTALATLSRVNYFLYPSLYSKWVYTGDFFRLAFYVALLLGALQEITTYWRAVSEARCWRSDDGSRATCTTGSRRRSRT